MGKKYAYLDAHLHLTAFGESEAAKLLSREDALLWNNSVNLDDFGKAKKFFSRSAGVRHGLGIHPSRAAAELGRLNQTLEAAEEADFLGECGLDFFYVEDDTDFEAQRRVLKAFLDLAARSGKVISLHTKGAENEILDLIEEYGIHKAVIHWYSGPLHLIPRYLNAGAFFSIGPDILYHPHSREIASRIPLGRLLSESDEPYVSGWYGEVADYSVLMDKTIEFLAAQKKISKSGLCDTVLDTARFLLGE